MDALQTYEVIKNYLLEKKFATTTEEANAIILNMEESWFQQINEEESEESAVEDNPKYFWYPEPSIEKDLFFFHSASLS